MGGWAGMDFSGQGIEWSQLPPSDLDHEISSFSFVSLGGAPRMLTGLEGSLNPRPWGERDLWADLPGVASKRCTLLPTVWSSMCLCLSGSVPQPGG